MIVEVDSRGRGGGFVHCGRRFRDNVQLYDNRRAGHDLHRGLRDRRPGRVRARLGDARFRRARLVYSGGTYTTLQFPGSSESSDTVGLQINDAGAVAGNFNTEAFLYSGGTGGTYTELDYPKSITTVATGIDASGAVAGYYTVGRKALASGYVYSGGAYTRIKYPKSSDTFVEGIDTSGAVAGYYIKGSQEFCFVDLGGAYTEIKYPKSSETRVEAISPSGASPATTSRETKNTASWNQVGPTLD